MNSKEIYNILLNRYFDEVSHTNTNDAIKQLFDKWNHFVLVYEHLFILFAITQV